MRILIVTFCFLLVLSACSSNHQAEAGFDQTLIGDPTLFVQDKNDDDLFRVANLTPGTRHDEFDPESIDQAIQDLFERGDGDDLYILKQALIPTAVWFGLEAGDGDPDGMIDTAWLGEIDGRIDTALNRTNYTPPTTLDEADVKRVIETGLAPLIAKSVDVEPTDDITTAISKTVATYNYNTGTGESDEEQNWTKENAETLIQRYQLVKALHDAQRIELPSNITDQQALEGENKLPLFDIPVLTADGKQVTNDGRPVDASDWDEELAAFDARNNFVEKID